MDSATAKPADTMRDFEITAADAELIVKLKPEHRAALQATGSYEDRAMRQGIAIGTVKSRTNRARKALIELRKTERA